MIYFFDVGILACMSTIWFTVSSDGVGIIDVSKLDFESEIDNCYSNNKTHPDKKEHTACKFNFALKGTNCIKAVNLKSQLVN